MALWVRDKSNISAEEYQSFYRGISKETTDAAAWIHFKAEGDIDFKSILYLPSQAKNLYDEYNTRKAGIRLYVRKVLIQEVCVIVDDFTLLLSLRIRNITKESNPLPHILLLLLFVFRTLKIFCLDI